VWRMQHDKHSKLSEEVQEMITNPAKKAGVKLKADACEYAYLPVVASGGTYPLRIGAECDAAKLHDGVVLLHLGAKYNSQCANICRTLFFRPTTQYAPSHPPVNCLQMLAVNSCSAINFVPLVKHLPSVVWQVH
jgi:nucleosome binding factor SPN SPT16 subunit